VHVARSPFVKICGVTSVADARLVRDAGADAIGLIFSTVSKRTVDAGVASAIAADADDHCVVVGVFKGNSEDEILRLSANVPLACVQLHDSPSATLVPALRAIGVKLVIAAFPFLDSIDARDFDMILLDGPTPGSGDLHDVSAHQIADATIPVLLAGGLTPDNVAERIRAVRPFGVDVASGTESSPGVKDAAKVASFVIRAREALFSGDER